jgi:TolA-binding protein
MIVGGSWSVLQISRLQKALEQARTGDSQKQLIEMQDRYSQLTAALQRDQAQLKLLEQEAANLKRGEKRGPSSLLPGQLQSTLIAVTLTPGQLRDFGGSPKIHIPAGTNLAQFDLKMEPEDYPQYQATLQPVDGGKIWTQISPKTESGTQGQFLRLIVPVNVLRPGDYVLKLSGKTTVGDFEDIANYYFRVIPR